MATYTKAMVLLLFVHALVSCTTVRQIEKDGYTVYLENSYAEQWKLEDSISWVPHSVIQRHEFNPYTITITRKEYLYGEED